MSPGFKNKLNKTKKLNFQTELMLKGNTTKQKKKAMKK